MMGANNALQVLSGQELDISSIHKSSTYILTLHKVSNLFTLDKNRKVLLYQKNQNFFLLPEESHLFICSY